ncbi:hypothetical protein BN440_1431 [Erwinia amylovora MR1]|nr:hypothetical protein BN440_1431 [Erwinia amylovora MR1]
MNRRNFIKTTGALSVAAACCGWPLSPLWAAETTPETAKKAAT